MTETKRSPGRPKKTLSDATNKVAPPTKTTRRKPTVVRRNEEVLLHAEYEIINAGGIVTMLPQKGVTVYDPEDDAVREIRYCPNEQSIWADEQGDKAKKQAVVFRERRLFVPKEKPNLRKFMDIHPMNAANGGNLFRQVDKKRDAEKELEQEFLLNDAISMVRDKSIEELLPVALFFGFNVNSPTSEIRFNLLNVAKKKPGEFIQSFDNPQVQARSIVKQAGDYQFINLKKDGVCWFDSNSLIVSVPVGQDPLDVMTRFCLTEKGASVLSSLEDKLSRLG
tara:strand:+ start:616 stop:1455 length:840 start_codon:yes stop_codon:yes gene_type:complete